MINSKHAYGVDPTRTGDRRQALCGTCGELRTVSRNYRGGGRVDEPKMAEWGNERCTITLLCAVCNQPTRHAFIRGDEAADCLEPLDRGRRLLEYLRTRWPNWKVSFSRDLPDGVREQFHPAEQQIVLDPSPQRLEFRIGHAVAHLVLHLNGQLHLEDGHHFTEGQDREADLVADIWLTQIAQREISRAEGSDER